MLVDGHTAPASEAGKSGCLGTVYVLTHVLSLQLWILQDFALWPLAVAGVFGPDHQAGYVEVKVVCCGMYASGCVRQRRQGYDSQGRRGGQPDVSQIGLAVVLLLHASGMGQGPLFTLAVCCHFIIPTATPAASGLSVLQSMQTQCNLHTDCACFTSRGMLLVLLYVVGCCAANCFSGSAPGFWVCLIVRRQQRRCLWNFSKTGRSCKGVHKLGSCQADFVA
jgi:hypothetical protein